MEHLCDDLLELIISYVGHKGYYNLSLVCRRWGALAPRVLINLERISCSYNKLTTLTLPPTLVKLKTLFCSNNKLTSLTVPPTLVNLQVIDCRDNNLKSLVVPERVSVYR